MQATASEMVHGRVRILVFICMIRFPLKPLIIPAIPAVVQLMLKNQDIDKTLIRQINFTYSPIVREYRINCYFSV
jgi:hypothetical protein